MWTRGLPSVLGCCRARRDSPTVRSVHQFTPEIDRLSRALADHCLDRLAMRAPLDTSLTPDQLDAAAGATVTAGGLGFDAVALWTDVLAPACLSVDHPRYLSFIPNAPTKAAAAFDMLVGASSVYGGSWLEGSGAVFAENQALRWLADLAGMPPAAGGAFVQGGTVGNLSALVAAREQAKLHRYAPPARWAVCVTTETHSSVKHALAVVMDVDVIQIPEDERGRMTGAALRRVVDAMSPEQRDGVFAVVTTAGSTNLGVVDDIAGCGEVARETAGGCTWTVPTAGPGWPRRACAPCSTGSSTPTRSSSIRTSGCSRRTTAAR